jgi:oligopeptide/dipeptide ABC transporter ATP-binding protein
MTDPLLDVQDVSVRYTLSRSFGDIIRRRSGRQLVAVDRARLAVQRGEAVGLVGESGSGKSSLGRALLRLTPASDGRVVFDGTDILELRKRELFRYRERAQMVFQDPFASLNPRLKVGDALGEVLRVHGKADRDNVDERVRELLETVGLAPAFADRRPRGLSGGQCQRVGIARALAVNPDVLIADEPVSALDLSIQAQILNLFIRLRREMGLALLFISHDLGVVHHLCQRVAVMYLGRIVEEGPADEIFHRPKHPYTQSLVDAMPRVERGRGARELPRLEGEPPSPANAPSGCAFHPRCPQAMPECRQNPPPAQRAVGSVTTACHLYPESG